MDGKTKKITKDDLIKIYMILEETDDPDDAIDTVEQILKQTIGNDEREWYELIDISDNFSEIYEEDDLMDSLDELLDDQLIPQIRNTIFGMSTNQKQAALTALQHLYYSVYKDSDLAFALLGIPVYGVKELDESEHTTALNDLLALYAKFNDLSMKNDSINTIREWQKRDEYYDSLYKEWIHTALDNFKRIIFKLHKEIHKKNPDLFSIKREFTTDVSFMIERGQPNVLKHYLKSWQTHTGKDLTTHIKECVNWFLGFGEEYDLPAIDDRLRGNYLLYGPRLYERKHPPRQYTPKRYRPKDSYAGKGVLEIFLDVFFGESQMHRLYLYYCYQLGILPKK